MLIGIRHLIAVGSGIYAFSDRRELGERAALQGLKNVTRHHR